MTESKSQPDDVSPAEVYENRFVPALFGPWAPSVLDHAGVGPGHHVLDVGCGTGVLARAAMARVTAEGSVIGVDPNGEMLAVARRKADGIEWVEGRAESLPFGAERFDRVVSQFAMMFFDDVPASLASMMRVLRPGGTLVAAVCDGIDHSPGYAVFTELLHRLFGAAIAEAFRAPFALGDRVTIARHAETAGLTGASVTRHEGTVRFDTIGDLVGTERACAWTLGGLLDDTQFTELVAAAEESLAPFVDSDGRLAFGMPTLMLRAEKA